MQLGLNIVAVGQSLVRRDIRATADPRFRAVVQRVRAADLAFTNFEGTIAGAHGGWPTKPSHFGAADPMVLDVLAELGFSALSLANNHAFDLGPGGVLSTLEEVGRRGFLSAGLGVDATAAARPGLRDMPAGRMGLVAVDAGPLAEPATAMDATAQIPARPGVNPLRVRPVFDVPAPVFAALQAIEAGLGHRARTGTYRRPRPVDSPDQLDFYGQRFRRAAEPRKAAAIEAADLARTLAAIRAARAEARFVIAYVHHHHWEAVWEDVPDWMRGFAHDCIDAGADLVASHGVPVVQGIEIYRGRPIFYSLGNFIFHSADPAGWHHADIWRSVIAECRFAADGSLAALGLSPIVLAGDVPLLALPNETDLLDKIVGLSAPFGTALRLADGRATLIR